MSIGAILTQHYIEFKILIMRRWHWGIIFFILILLTLAPAVLGLGAKPDKEDLNMSEQKGSLILSSPAFKDQEYIPAKYSCEGKNINPLLKIENVPAGTNSLTLIVDDPDAPLGTFTHWVLFNIPPQTRQIGENETPPESLQGKNSAGSSKYTGPCPPPGKIHHYHFKLFALDAILDLKEGVGKVDVEKSIRNHILAQISLVGLFKR
jgi:hypothetical protein